MSSQRYSLSAKLTHIVCSKRHLPALLSVMAGTACPLYHQNQVPVNILAARVGMEAAGSPGLAASPGRIGAGSTARGARLNPQSFQRSFLFWAILHASSGHTYSRSLTAGSHRKGQHNEHCGL